LTFFAKGKGGKRALLPTLIHAFSWMPLLIL
jgi:hypothetical protein